MDTPLQRFTKTDTFTQNLETGTIRMETGTILIVDDNKGVLTSLEFLLENEFSQILTASNPNQITSILSNTSVDVVILDMNFTTGINNGNEGLYWLNHIRQAAPQIGRASCRERVCQYV